MRKYEPKLKQGDIIEVHGFVMLRKVEGKLRVDEVFNYKGILVYRFCKPRGKKTIVCHSVTDVDMWLEREDEDEESLNKIKIIN
ncbi:MAG: hypothetical protein ACOCUI_03145 [bacterium]